MTIGALGSTTAEGVKGQGLLQGLKLPNFAEILAWFWSQVKAQEAHLFLYVPFFLMFGDWIYFDLTWEPSLLATVVVAAIAAALLVQRRNNAALFLAGVLLVGIATTKLREWEVETPMLRGPTSGVSMAGWIANFSPRNNGARMLEIEVAEASGIPDGETPRRVRIYATESEWLEVGDFIKFNAYLSPLPRPVIPGGFDYGRSMFFSSVGAGGRLIGEPTLVQAEVPWRFQYRRIFRSLRLVINERIFAVIPGGLGHFGASMVTGERYGIGDEITTSVQISGLAHMVGVAGLHMSIVGGFTFWLVRACLALFPFLALRYPIKKWAAVAGLLVCLLYMLLADAGSRTERSFIMTATMFIAILLDRPGFSMRNLALSAVIVLLLTPEESLGASFQMSYLAVMAIIAFHSWYRTMRGTYVHPKTWGARAWAHAKDAVIRGAGISICAGSATGIAAAYQFGRMEPYTVFANGLALPVAELTVLPPAVVAVAAMPFHLEYVPLKVMQFGLWFTMLISDWVASWPGANWIVAKPNTFGIVIMVMGAGVLCVGLGRLRYFGWPILMLGIFVATFMERPFVLVEDRAANVAIVDHGGEIVLANKTNKFATNRWLQGNGETATFLEAADRPGWDCSSGDCFSTQSGPEVSYLHEKSGNGLYCPPTEIIIADFPLHRQCHEAKVVIDRIDVWKKGAYALYRSGGRLTVKNARDEQGARPWAYDSRKGIRPAKELSAPPTTIPVQG